VSALRQDCLHHPHRGAVARCPACAQSFCRECVVEHEGKLLCTDCLEAKKVKNDERPVAWWQLPIWPWVQILLGLVMLSALFYASGRIVRAIPPDYHNGIKWEK
jgi:hypothetical protein